MISYNKCVFAGPGKNLVEAVGLSTDSKPTGGIVNGSVFLEMDTGKVYLYDEAGSQWLEF